MRIKYWKYRLAAGVLASLLAATAAGEAAIAAESVETESQVESFAEAVTTGWEDLEQTSEQISEAWQELYSESEIWTEESSVSGSTETDSQAQTEAEAGSSPEITMEESSGAENTSAEESGTGTAPEETTAEIATEENTSSEQTSAEQTAEEDTSAENTSAEQTDTESETAESTTDESTSSEQTSAEQTTVEDTSDEQSTEEASSETQTVSRDLVECDMEGYAFAATPVYMKADLQASPAYTMPEGTMMSVRSVIMENDEICWYRVIFAMDEIGYEGYIRPDTVDVYGGTSTFDLSEDVDMTDQFPADYQALIEALKAKYPNWIFQPLYTNLDFQYAVDQEQSLVNRNLVHISQIMDWKSLKSLGADANGNVYNYNWQTDTWYEWEPKIVAASDESVAYCMDPRNFIDERYIFMFEDLSYHEEFQTEESVNALLKGTFMYNTNVPGEEFTYAWLLHWVGQRYGINPVMLASRLRQEQGIYGTSELISGVYPGYESLYNHYNTVASGPTREEIIRTGLEAAKKGSSMVLPYSLSGETDEDGEPIEEAYTGPWDTPTKSIIGGCLYIATTYIMIGQDSLYLQKFDVDDSDGRLFWHQYMQNVQAPISESKTVKMSYTNMGLLDQPFVFSIPVFDNMPASTPAPTSDLNPNNCLNRLAVNGRRVFTEFKKDVSDFTIEVGYSTETARIEIIPASDRATFTTVPDMALRVGSNKCSFTVTAQTGDVRTYTLNIIRLEEGVPEPDVAPEDEELKYGELLLDGTKVYIGLENDRKGSVYIPYYNMNASEDGQFIMIDGVSEGTDAQTFLKNIDVKGNIWAGLFYGEDLTQRKGTDPVGTGTYLIISDHGTGQIIMCSPIIIYGDVTGDGVVNIIDFSVGKAALLGRYTMTEEQEFASDLNGDGIFNIIDFSIIKAVLLGRYELIQ